MRRRFLFATAGLAVAMVLLSHVASAQTVQGDSVVGDGGATGCPFIQDCCASTLAITDDARVSSGASV
jgi:hypothetical protein